MDRPLTRLSPEDRRHSPSFESTVFSFRTTVPFLILASLPFSTLPESSLSSLPAAELRTVRSARSSPTVIHRSEVPLMFNLYFFISWPPPRSLLQAFPFHLTSLLSFRRTPPLVLNYSHAKGFKIAPLAPLFATATSFVTLFLSSDVSFGFLL